MSFEPYLHFQGFCAEAMAFYASIFGGVLTLRRFRDLPGGDPGDDAVWHAQLVLGHGVLMASDRPLGSPAAAQSGVTINHDAPDATAAARIFAALAVGGTVTVPMATTPWSPAFGALTDRFGTAWMINTVAPVEGS